MSFKQFLNQIGTIQRKTKTKNDYKQIISVWDVPEPEENYTNIKCRIEYYLFSSSQLIQGIGGQKNTNEYLGFFMPNIDILVGDRFLWNDLILYARPVNFIYGSKNKVHHYEVPFGLQET